MDVVFVYESRHPIEVKDGLTTSLEALKDTFNISKVNIATQEPSFKKDDFILGWGAFGSEVDRLVRQYPNKKGLCIGGCSEPYDTLDYDVLFYETKWFRDKIKFHPNIVHAFGIDTSVYYNMNVERDVDYLGVGAYALWKRWDKFVGLKGKRRVIGEFQRGNPEESQQIWDMLESDGVVCKDMVKAQTLNCEYNRAKTVYIPATLMGGGERAILEARSCGCKLKVEDDNPKLKELLTCPIYDISYYTKQLKEGLCL